MKNEKIYRFNSNFGDYMNKYFGYCEVGVISLGSLGIFKNKKEIISWR